MKYNGTHIIRYTISGEKGEVKVNVQLKQHQGLGKPGQNLWYGIASVNDKEFEHPDLANCVNAQFMAISIAHEEIEKLRVEHGRALRIKRK
jgi:hypothetical protein